MNLAPIAQFVYNRPGHAEKTLLSLSKNRLFDKSKIFIFSDGPKDAADEKKVIEVRRMLRGMAGIGDIRIIERDKNIGLAGSIIGGVSEVLSKFDKIIVVEDDLVLSKYFLQYMNDALDVYRSEDKVMHVSGYMFPIDTSGLGSTFFYNQASSWGWGTWSRAWRLLNTDARYLYHEIKKRKMLKEFDLGVTAGFSSQLIKNMERRIDTWAIKWHASIFLEEGLCLHPSRSLVRNIGHDGSGSHCRISRIYDVPFASEPVEVIKQSKVENTLARERMAAWFKNNELTFIQKLKRKISDLGIF